MAKVLRGFDAGAVGRNWSSMPDLDTLRFYAEEATVYAAATSTAPSPDLDAFLAGLPQGGRILELGCGGGRDAVAMLMLGYQVEATDGSPEMAHQAEARLGRPVQVMRFDQLAATAVFDGVWANASLLHAPRSEMTDVLRRVHSALVPGGLFYASYKAGAGEGRDTLGRYYNYPSTAELEQVYRDGGRWQSLSLLESAGTGYDGRATCWIIVLARKA